MPKPLKSVQFQLDNYVRIDESTGCWVWVHKLNVDGYGIAHARVRGILARTAHRMSYLRFIGDVPEGLEIDHVCRNRACCNPSHLEAVTHAENVKRSDNTGKRHNALKTHCKYGHPFDEENTGVDALKSGKPHRRCKACDREKKRGIVKEKIEEINERRRGAYKMKKKLMAERGFEIVEV